MKVRQGRRPGVDLVIVRLFLSILITPSLQIPARPEEPIPRGGAIISAFLAVPEPTIFLIAHPCTLQSTHFGCLTKLVHRPKYQSVCSSLANFHSSKTFRLPMNEKYHDGSPCLMRQPWSHLPEYPRSNFFFWFDERYFQ